MIVRKAEIKNLDELRKIGIDSYQPHYAHLWKNGGIEWYQERCFGEEFLINELADRNVEYYIAESGGNNVGMMKLVLHKPLPDSNAENALYLEKIYFVKEWTGRGAGAKLIEFAVSRAAQLNRECVWLMAMDTSEKPIAAYRKSGFAIQSYTNLGAEFGLMKEEFRGMVVMSRFLENNGK